jgi:hypothetical protein
MFIITVSGLIEIFFTSCSRNVYILLSKFWSQKALCSYAKGLFIVNIEISKIYPIDGLEI